MSSHPDNMGSFEKRFAAFEASTEFHEYQLRHDVATLMESGMSKHQGMQQKALADLTGKQESYISRLIHSEANCNLSTVVEVLVPLGITPKIVDEADWERLRAMEETIGAMFGTSASERTVEETPAVVTSTATTTYKIVQNDTTLIGRSDYGRESGINESTADFDFHPVFREETRSRTHCSTRETIRVGGSCAVLTSP